MEQQLHHHSSYINLHLLLLAFEFLYDIFYVQAYMVCTPIDNPKFAIPKPIISN